MSSCGKFCTESLSPNILLNFKPDFEVSYHLFTKTNGIAMDMKNSVSDGFDMSVK